ncbi:MAG: cobalamin B12-binding domain-containing protein [Aestuariivita sp.]|nr:cobalamin B12-binding domain-containing protein [Aestuariivita sp.]
MIAIEYILPIKVAVHHRFEPESRIMTCEDKKKSTNRLNTDEANIFGMLARNVISELNARRAHNLTKDIHGFVESFLYKRVVSKAHFCVHNTINDLQALQLTSIDIIDKYIPKTAHAIGEAWVNSDLSFAEVTIASSRLQTLLSEIDRRNFNTTFRGHPQLKMLVIVLAQDQHNLGSLVLASKLRRNGVSVKNILAESNDTVRSVILDGWYDAVLFSSSRRKDLSNIIEIVTTAKYRMCNAPIFALGGIILNLYPELPKDDSSQSFDLISNDVDEIITYCAEKQVSLGTLKQVI